MGGRSATFTKQAVIPKSPAETQALPKNRPDWTQFPTSYDIYEYRGLGAKVIAEILHAMWNEMGCEPQTPDRIERRVRKLLKADHFFNELFDCAEDDELRSVAFNQAFYDDQHETRYRYLPNYARQKRTARRNTPSIGSLVRVGKNHKIEKELKKLQRRKEEEDGDDDPGDEDYKPQSVVSPPKKVRSARVLASARMYQEEGSVSDTKEVTTADFVTGEDDFEEEEVLEEVEETPKVKTYQRKKKTVVSALPKSALEAVTIDVPDLSLLTDVPTAESRSNPTTKTTMKDLFGEQAESFKVDEESPSGISQESEESFHLLVKCKELEKKLRSEQVKSALYREALANDAFADAVEKSDLSARTVELYKEHAERYRETLEFFVENIVNACPKNRTLAKVFHDFEFKAAEKRDKDAAALAQIVRFFRKDPQANAVASMRCVESFVKKFSAKGTSILPKPVDLAEAEERLDLIKEKVRVKFGTKKSVLQDVDPDDEIFLSGESYDPRWEFRCGDCGAIKSNDHALEDHQDFECRTPRRKQCTICAHRIEVADFAAHVEEHERAFDLGEKVTCDLCPGGKRVARRDLNRHKWSEHRSPESYCVHCDEVFKDPVAFFRHWRHKVLVVRHKYDSVDVICEYCAAVVKYCSIKAHFCEEKIARGLGRNVLCTDCGENFPTKNAHANHRALHHNDGHRCEFCGTAYGSLGMLNKHLLTHTNIKPYYCPFCPHLVTQVKSVVITHIKGKHPDRVDAISYAEVPVIASELEKEKRFLKNVEEGKKEFIYCLDEIPGKYLKARNKTGSGGRQFSASAAGAESKRGKRGPRKRSSYVIPEQHARPAAATKNDPEPGPDPVWQPQVTADGFATSGFQGQPDRVEESYQDPWGGDASYFHQ